MYNIITSMCVDPDHSGSSVRYPNLGRRNSDRRAIYWRCVYTFCWSSLKVNSEQRHVVYTNDEAACVLDGVDLREALEAMGVQVIRLPFREFDPKGRSRRFRNAFYKLEVVKAMSNMTEPSILLDSDCLWHKPAERIGEELYSGARLLLQDTYKRSHNPTSKVPHGLSMADFGAVYRDIDPAYPVRHPIWYGGEIIGGSPEILTSVAQSFSAIFGKLINLKTDLRLPNGDSIFDNDEFVTSFVYNLGNVEILDTMGLFSVRLATARPRRTLHPSVVDVPIWHLPYEKTRGLDVLFGSIVGGDLGDVPRKDLTRVLGGYVGVPRRNVKRYIDWLDYGKSAVRYVVN